MKHYLRDFFREISVLPEREQIIAFCKKFEDLPKQGTEEWLKDRKIGGSDSYKALNDKNFLKNKSKPFKKNLIMEWGNLMEPVVVQYLSQYMEIFTTNSVPGFGDEKKNYTSYSPDGIIFGGESYGLSGINLLEIKTPAIRAPSGFVPEIYKPQIQLGLSTLEFCKKCFYIECYAKTCSLTNFCFNKITTGFSKYKIQAEPIAIGFVSFFGDFKSCEPFEFTFPENLSFMPNSTKRLCEKRIKFSGIDFGSRNSCFYKTCALTTYEYEKKYSPLLFDKTADPIEFFEKEYEKIGGDGVLCYKIFEFNHFIVEKENFDESIKKLIEIGKFLF